MVTQERETVLAFPGNRAGVSRKMWYDNMNILMGLWQARPHSRGRGRRNAMHLNRAGGKTLWQTLLQFIKFGIVGASNTLISLAVYYLFIWIDKDLYLAGQIAGFIVSVLNAYYWNNRYVFKGGRLWDWKKLLKTFTAYGGTSLLSMALSVAEVEWLHLSEYIVPVINLVITIPLNFLTHKFWVYRKKKDKIAGRNNTGMRLSDYLADFLVENGIDTVFSVTGGGAMHLNDALGHKAGLKVFYCHHEQACAMAAESYARLTGRIAAVCVTSGPGGTNAITGVMGGYLDSIPMFIVSGQVKRATTIRSVPELPLRQLGDQEFDIISCVGCMTKYAAFVDAPNDIRMHLEKAMYLATHGRKGPVWLDIPLDVQAAQIETGSLPAYDSAKDAKREIPPAFTDKQARELLDKITAAKRPVVLAGGGIRQSSGYDAFLALIDRLGVPVVTAWNAHDALWDSHPLYCGRPGSMGTRGGNFVVENADLLLTLGCRLNVRQVSYNWKSFARHAYTILVDIDKAELKKPTLRVDMPVWGDVKNVMEALLAQPRPEKNAAHDAWLAWCRAVDAKYPAVLPAYYEKNQPVNPYIFMKALGEHLRENEVTVTGNGSACVCSFQAMEIKKGQRLYTNSGCASMGYGTPAAMGAAIAMRGTGKRVICLDGDGSFQMNLQELMTIVYHKLPIKLFYLNNNGYHSIRQTQTNTFPGPMVGVSPENGVGMPDIEKLAGAYGIPFNRIDRLDTLDETLAQVLAGDGLCLTEVMLDPAQFFAPKLSGKAQPDGTIVSPPIEDMYPFLERAEYTENMIAEQQEGE